MKRSCGVCVCLCVWCWVIKFNCDWCVCVSRSGCFMAVIHAWLLCACVIDCISRRHGLNALLLLSHAHVCVSCRTTSTWMKRHTSWWRIYWLTTKGCRTRRATVTASNWIRSPWLQRASRVAANAQSVHIPAPWWTLIWWRHPRLPNPPPQFSEEECFLGRGGGCQSSRIFSL